MRMQSSCGCVEYADREGNPERVILCPNHKIQYVARREERKGMDPLAEGRNIFLTS